MKEAQALIDRIEWIIDPLIRIFLFLFTTKNGLLTLGILLSLYIIFTIGNALYMRRLLSSASKSGYGGGRLLGLEKLYVIFSEIGKILSRIVYNLPVVLGIFVFFIMIGGLAAGLKKFNEFVDGNIKVQELSAVVRQLDESYKVAEIKVKSVDYTQFPKVLTTLTVSYFDYAGTGLKNSEQEIQIEGNDIYVDAIVLNFQYSEITNGSRKNISIPYRIFSNKVAQKDGIKLNLFDENGVPFVFKKKAKDIFSLEEEKYNQRLTEICNFMNDEELARKNGVRSIYGSAVHTLVKTNDIITISVEQTGGLVLKKKLAF